MRDLQRLEKLSSTVALGMWADDVVLALNRALTPGGANSADAELLNHAAEVLEEARQRVAQPLSAPKSSGALAATDTTLTAVALLAREQATDEQQMLADMAGVIRKVADNTLSDGGSGHVQSAMNLFAMIGEHQLVESNAVLTTRKDMRLWTAPHKISSFS